MWTPEDRALVGDFGSGQALSDDQYRRIKPFLPPAKPGGRPRTTDMRRMLDGLFYTVCSMSCALDANGATCRRLQRFRRGRRSTATFGPS
jgi:transposase